MPNRNSLRYRLKDFDRRFFRATGFMFSSLLKAAVVLVVAVVCISLTIRYTNTERSGGVSGLDGVVAKRLTSEEQFVEISNLPQGFSKKQPVEKIGILQSKIEVGEALVRSGGQYAQRAKDQLVQTYGRLCQLQDSVGIDSQKAYGRLAELRQDALSTGNEDRVAEVDFHRAFSATSRLRQYDERADFRFATDAILNLDSRKMVNAKRINQLFSVAINLHDTSPKQDSTAIFLSILGDKLIDSPVSEISTLGLSLKDHVKYARYYTAVYELPPSTRESKVQFYNGLFEKIEKSPPQSPKTYQVVVRLIDRLLNRSDAEFASTLAKRLGKAASLISPKIKADVDASIKNIETRIALLGESVDLTGSNYKGSALQLPNDKPTTLVFWRFGDLESMEHVQSIAKSERFDSWETNVLLAGLSQLTEEQFTAAEDIIGNFTILDNATSSRLGVEIGIDLVPYQVALDKDGKVIRLGQITN
jgi:hypothetical protein